MAEADEEQAHGEVTPAVRLNAGEDAVAWAIAHFGADPQLVRSMRPESRIGVRAVLERLPEDDADRVLELEDWRERARVADRVESKVAQFGVPSGGLGARWTHRVDVLLERGPSPGEGPCLRAQLAVLGVAVGDDASLEWPHDDQHDSPVGLRRLGRMSSDALHDALCTIGVWQIAAFVSGHGRRRAARVRSKIPERWSDTFQLGLEKNGEMSPAAKTRVQEVYLGLNRHGFGFSETVEQLGLFAVVAACGGRFERRLDVWIRDLPSQLADRTRRLSRLNERALRLRIGPAFRDSMERFWIHVGSVGEHERLDDE